MRDVHFARTASGLVVATVEDDPDAVLKHLLELEVPPYGAQLLEQLDAVLEGRQAGFSYLGQMAAVDVVGDRATVFDYVTERSTEIGLAELRALVIARQNCEAA